MNTRNALNMRGFSTTTIITPHYYYYILEKKKATATIPASFFKKSRDPLNFSAKVAKISPESLDFCALPVGFYLNFRERSPTNYSYFYQSPLAEVLQPSTMGFWSPS